MKPRDRLRIAMQKSGRLTEPGLDLLKRCGLTFRQSRDKLFCFGEGEPVDLLLVRDDDIPGLIAQGVCDLGIVGRNVLAEFQLTAGRETAALSELRPLGFGRCRLSIAVPQELDYQSPQQLSGLSIATSYPGLLGEWLRTQGVEAGVVTLAGSVEIAPRLGTADAICDLVQSGGTLVANQLREADVLLESEAVLAGPEILPADERGDMLELLLKRLDGVIQVRESRLLLLQTSRSTLESITRLLPGGPQPTLLPVEGQPDQLMLQALCAGEVSWRQLEEIKRAGAREMFVLPVEKMLA
ncbi:MULTISPECIES: ATP phosphoribosyltransferase [Rhodanobacter]|uniref:ATP phosphoribosyltransferase n=1 Tax=Rhodanobacter glycinis TaxID=582702 RepID=A0A1I4CK36_9GAMM|nr:MULTISPECIES: ATP phosphoribosyltransferase [Rhodanobacter]EIL95747.1 ATP phosphoribosyltransferase [Rhodanobacter sp. 115]QEE25049.1 ATP phosphoribosyltransferase [Rhodanobacter glycinis]TAM24443.1 MAG: ATP phosphoribosyltransferase [Rhodanobacter sp.]SFK81652.1 ATP phosphoribosyltransferase (homohexameric) [Rhodanobacter glycinis]